MKGILPVRNAALTTEYRNYKPYHTGIDLGWITGSTNDEIYCDVMAWRDGVVVNVAYDANSRGNHITLRHQDGNTYQYTNYLHLRDVPCVAVGDVVKQGQKIGVRGTTGLVSTGVHLHFAVSVETTGAGYSTQWVADNTLDPRTVTYLSPDVDYQLHSNMAWCSPITVEKDTTKHQFEVTCTDLNIRTGPGKSYSKTGKYIETGLYTILEQSVETNGYTWSRISSDRWIATAWCGDSSTYGVDYPVGEDDGKDQKIKNLEAQVKELQEEVDKKTKAIETAEAALATGK